MSNPSVDAVISKISAKHLSDARQLEVIFSTADRILVEAPAGYGKTNTMVSKIAYLVATQQLPSPKRLLALTFSVNAAYKIKKDVIQQIPELLKDTDLDINVSNKVFVSNYHGFCRSILKKYGHHFNAALFDIDKFQSVDDSDIARLMSSISGLSYSNAEFMSNFNETLRSANERALMGNLDKYNDIVIKEVLPKRSIPYNAILTLTIKLFNDYPKLLEFYRKYFRAILVDEYQDTNILSYWLICFLITDTTKVILLGDSLQRIYGFIGAVPGLLSISEKKFGLTKIPLCTNHRFASNPQMLLLDSNIRSNAINPRAPVILENVDIDLDMAPDQSTEGKKIVAKAVSLIGGTTKTKVAILVKQRGPNINAIISEFEQANISYFYGLFTDDDIEYVKFHGNCLYEFIDLLRSKKQITKKLSATHIKKICDLYCGTTNPLIDSLILLLKIFWGKFFIEYAFLADEEKTGLVRDVFEHNSLKQYIEFINTSIIISTVHAAKGLEWDFVILADMEQNLFPNWFGLCQSCACSANCKLIVTNQNEKAFLEELSVFYVAVTRAKKQVYFTASRTQLDNFGNQRVKKSSCFLGLPGTHLCLTN
jgi:DNA helicase-2/ATP-dependent DNA helicase PcrA